MERCTVKLLGFDIDTFTFEQACEYANNICGQVVTINPEMLSYSLKDVDFAKIINSANLVIPDGVGVEIGLKINGHKVRRIPGIEFAHKMIEICAKNNNSIALIGARAEVLEKAKENLEKEFPRLYITYCQDGYFNDENKILNELKIRQPRLVLCALGSPKQ